MWIRKGSTIRMMGPGETIFRDGNKIRLRSFSGEGSIRREHLIAVYETEDRAVEVLQAFWDHVKFRSDGYEFPES